jgi:hypothetical protein
MAQTPTKPEPAAAIREPIKLPVAVSPTSVELKAWSKTMHHTPAPKGGCFNASYPSTQWQEVQCAPPNGWHPAFSRKLNQKAESLGQTVGGTDPGNNDIIVQTPTGLLFSNVEGSFPTVSGVTSETGVGVAYYGGGGFLGPNEYSLQLNTNSANTAACSGYSYCQAWVQYVMATNSTVSATDNTLTNQTEVFIETSLLNYGSAPGQCPTGWNDAGTIGPGDYCWVNLPPNVVDWNPPTNLGQLPMNDTNLADLTLSGSATAGGNDAATVTYGGHAYTATAPDSYTDIASVWNQAEFNVVGNAGGSQAEFNPGITCVATTGTNCAVIVVQSAVTYTNGSMSAPICVLNGGSTGEQNNLNLTAPPTPTCCANPGVSGGALPNIQFAESNNPNEWAKCSNPIIVGDPHITTVDGTTYGFQGAGEYVTLLDPDGTEVQTRQTPLATNLITAQDETGLTTCVSMNTAVAARVGTHRVTYEPSFSGAYDSGSFQLRIDGALTTLGAPLNLAGGGQVKNSSGGIEIDFPDGKVLTVTPGTWDSMWKLDLQFSSLGVVSKSAGASESGLAGVVPNGSWLPALPNGASVGSLPTNLQTRYNTLYKTFGPAWRVTSSNSLFDYAPGTSTATFANAAWLEAWPNGQNATSCTIPNQKAVKPVSAAVAEAACKSITDTNLHSNCVFDVQVTGNTGFADTYLVTDRVHTNLAVKPITIKPITINPVAIEMK